MNLAKKLHGGRLKARFAGIIDRDDRVDFNLDDARAGMDPAGSFDALSFKLHRSPIEVMHCHQLRRPMMRQPWPDGIDRCTVRQHLFHLDCRVGLRRRALYSQLTFLQSGHHLPIRNSTIIKLVTRMNTNHITTFGNGIPNLIE